MYKIILLVPYVISCFEKKLKLFKNKILLKYLGVSTIKKMGNLAYYVIHVRHLLSLM
jgi:hypothetical protein